MASSRKNIDLCPELYDYHACFTRPRIVEYYSIGKNFELAENLSSLNYVTAKSGLLNLDIKVKEKKLEEKSFRENKEMMRLDLFFKFITNHHEIIQRYTGTKIEDAGFVFGKKTLTKIGNALYDKNDTFMLCAHLLRGVIYVQVHYDTILFDSNIKFDPRMFYEYCYLSSMYIYIL